MNIGQGVKSKGSASNLHDVLKWERDDEIFSGPSYRHIITKTWVRGALRGCGLMLAQVSFYNL